MSAPSLLIVMGVAGSGKSTTAALLSERLGWPWRDADTFHPPANIEKMSRGVPLTDQDRWPWLDAIGAWMDDRTAAGEQGIVTCSALKRIYRDRLIAGRPGARLVHLVGSRDLIGERMAARQDHFMPPALLDSQFAALEAPDPDEGVLSVKVDRPPEEVVAWIVAAFRL